MQRPSNWIRENTWKDIKNFVVQMYMLPPTSICIIPGMVFIYTETNLIYDKTILSLILTKVAIMEKVDYF